MGSAQTYLKIQSKKIEKQQFENRKAQVSDVKAKVNTVSADDVKAINEKIEQIKAELKSALDGINTSTMHEELDTYKQKDADSDLHLSAAKGNLQAEVSDCASKISELENEISNLQTQYDNEVRAEEEARRAALEAARRAAEEAARRAEEAFNIGKSR